MLFYIVLVFFFTLAAFGLLFRALSRRMGAGTCDPLDWLDDFSATSYRPMERLLNAGDAVFLASQKGFEPSIGRRLRRQRIGIFQSYLGAMIRDFHRLMAIAKFITVYASQDSTDFESALWRLRLSFYGAVAATELRLAMSLIGIGEVDAKSVLGSLERMQVYTQNLMPALEPAA